MVAHDEGGLVELMRKLGTQAIRLKINHTTLRAWIGMQVCLDGLSVTTGNREEPAHKVPQVGSTYG